MGLSSRKSKQKIGSDPRNLSWADDAARFGSNYLSKFGWDSSQGLGADGDGRTSHIKVAHKLDMLGIGAAQQKDPNGVAWKQNTDFENVLKRLNKSIELEKKDDELVVDEVTEKKTKKRKHEESNESKKDRKKKRQTNEIVVENQNPPAAETKVMDNVAETVSFSVQKPVIPRHRSHRARAIAAKKMTSMSSVHLSEILGVSVSSLGSTPISELESDSHVLEIGTITTSTKSVSDYFRDKLKGNNSNRHLKTEEESSDHGEVTRVGLGFSSQSSLEFQAQTNVLDNQQKFGQSKFSSMSNLTSTSSFIPESQEENNNGIQNQPSIPDTSETESSNKEKRKEKKKKEKESRRKTHEEQLGDLSTEKLLGATSKDKVDRKLHKKKKRKNNHVPS